MGWGGGAGEVGVRVIHIWAMTRLGYRVCVGGRVGLGGGIRAIQIWATTRPAYRVGCKWGGTGCVGLGLFISGL